MDKVLLLCLPRWSPIQVQTRPDVTKSIEQVKVVTTVIDWLHIKMNKLSRQRNPVFDTCLHMQLVTKFKHSKYVT